MAITIGLLGLLILFLMHGGAVAGIAVVAFGLWLMFPIDFSTACIIAIVLSIFIIVYCEFIDSKVKVKQNQKFINETMPTIRKAMKETGISQDVPFYTFVLENKKYKTILVLYDANIPIYTRVCPENYENMPLTNILEIKCVFSDIQIKEGTFGGYTEEYYQIHFSDSEKGRQQKMQAYNTIKRICGLN